LSRSDKPGVIIARVDAGVNDPDGLAVVKSGVGTQAAKASK
jgi:hypothetical protein